jgi:hypothetical protein
MPLPDPFFNEPFVQLDPDKVKLWRQAVDAARAWGEEAEKRRDELIADLGDAHAGKVGDDKVITYRPETRWAEARLVKENPDLAQHFFRSQTREVFALTEFREHHPEIAEKYRVRSFRGVE